jgi:uncharacterized protein YegP (UPF0339 family)
MKHLVRFEVYCTAPNKWFWRLRHRNKKILADGGESYQTRGALKKSLENAIRAISNGQWEIVESVPERARRATKASSIERAFGSRVA